jgi:hypothetical protein
MRRDAQFWAKAQRGIEANSETIAITRPKVVEAAAVVDEPALGPYVYRAAYVEYGTALARALTREDFEKARREYLKWLRDRGRYFFSELADAKAKAYVRRPSRMPAANGSDIGAADTGVIVQAEPAPITGNGSAFTSSAILCPTSPTPIGGAVPAFLIARLRGAAARRNRKSAKPRRSRDGSSCP